MKKSLVSLLVLGVLIVGGIANADVDANVAIYQAAFDDAIDADVDQNGGFQAPATLLPNGILDQAEAHLIFAILNNDSAPNHVAIHAAWTANLARATTDLALGMFAPYRPVVAVYTTIGTPESFQSIAAFVSTYGVSLNPANYNLTAAGWLGPNGDLDGDDYTNLVEFEGAADEAAYITGAQTVNAPPTLTVTVAGNVSGAMTPSGTSVTLTATAVSGTAPYTYVWKKDGVATGDTGASLTFVAAVADSGTYTCQVTDSSAPAGTVDSSNSVVLNVMDAANLPAMGIAGIVLLAGLAGALGARKIRK